MKYNYELFYLSPKSKKGQILKIFSLALKESKDLALTNLLYILDIRKGKGQRRIFKYIFKYLCINEVELARKVLPAIEKLGRYDLILVGLNTPLESDIVKLINRRLMIDLNSDFPSLLAKWLPSLRTHKKNNIEAKRLVKLLNMKEKDYRKLLSLLRDKIHVVEKDLSNKEYDKIDFKFVPVKAFYKYERVFEDKLNTEYLSYKESKVQKEVKLKRYIKILGKYRKYIK